MGRFFLRPEDIAGNKARITGGEARHICEVLRLSLGDEIQMFDGQGTEYSGIISRIDDRGKNLTVEITSSCKAPVLENPSITLAQAIPKKNKMDYIVEKATELGVSRIIPLISERTIVRPDPRAAVKMTERWRKISVEASKQCSRVCVPEIGEILMFKDLVSGAAEYDLKVLACLSGKTVPLRSVIPHPFPKKCISLIGPEGDFSENEALFARENGFLLVNFGKTVLKSDTAGLFAISVMGYEAGNFSM